jgi:hypothetical protein
VTVAPKWQNKAHKLLVTPPFDLITGRARSEDVLAMCRESIQWSARRDLVEEFPSQWFATVLLDAAPGDVDAEAYRIVVYLNQEYILSHI